MSDILLQDGKMAGAWDIVGGRINPGTELIENLKREIKEETQLKLSSEPKLIAAQDILMPERHVVRLTYTAYADGEPILDLSENGEYRWLTFDELAIVDDLDVFVKKLIASNTLCSDSWN
jgi:8-oxo-dGTP pyrophosphatase MutT (NUDIX family)